MTLTLNPKVANQQDRKRGLPVLLERWHREGAPGVIDGLEPFAGLFARFNEELLGLATREPLVLHPWQYEQLRGVLAADWQPQPEPQSRAENFVRSFAPGSHGVRLFPNLPPEHARNGLDFRNSPRVAEERSAR